MPKQDWSWAPGCPSHKEKNCTKPGTCDKLHQPQGPAPVVLEALCMHAMTTRLWAQAGKAVFGLPYKHGAHQIIEAESCEDSIHVATFAISVRPLEAPGCAFVPQASAATTAEAVWCRQVECHEADSGSAFSLALLLPAPTRPGSSKAGNVVSLIRRARELRENERQM